MSHTNFANLEADELIRDLHERYINFLAYRKTRFENRWNKNRRFYYNQHIEDGLWEQGVRVGGRQGELTLVSVNHFRNLILNMLNLIIGTKPAFQARAINSDAESLLQAELANGLLDYYTKEKGMGDVIKRAVEESLIHDSSYVSVTWDTMAGKEFAVGPEDTLEYEGDLRFVTLSPFEVIFDQTRRDWKENDWVMTYHMRSKWDLIAEFPELQDLIERADTGDADNALADSDRNYSQDIKTDDVKVFEFYHRKSSSVPEGRYTMFIDGVVLFDDVLPYREIPIYQITGGRDLTSQFGYSIANDLVPLQELVNSHYSAINSNHEAFGVQKIAVARGSKVKHQSITTNLSFIEYDETGGGPPQGINLTNTPGEMFSHLKDLEGAMETISGINSVIRGKPVSGVTSGTALALLQNQSIQFINHLQESYQALIENVGTASIRILKDFAKSPRIAIIAGKSRAAAMREFESKDLENVDRVLVDLGNPLTHTLAGKVELANQLIQTGLIQNPQQYLAVVQSGNLEALTEAGTTEINYIREENEALLEGVNPVVAITDDHRKHILEHTVILQNVENRTNEALMSNVLEHIQQHINFLQDPNLQPLFQTLGRQGLTPAQPTGPAPAPEGLVDPAAMGQPNQVGVAPGAAPVNMPEAATPPPTALPR